MKSVIKPLAESEIPLGLTAAASATGAGIHKKYLRFWICNTNNIK